MSILDLLVVILGCAAILWVSGRIKIDTEGWDWDWLKVAVVAVIIITAVAGGIDSVIWTFAKADVYVYQNKR
jgi:hypothetical protein